MKQLLNAKEIKIYYKSNFFKMFLCLWGKKEQTNCALHHIREPHVCGPLICNCLCPSCVVLYLKDDTP